MEQRREVRDLGLRRLPRLHMENRLASEDRSREAGRVSRNHDFQVGGGGSGRGEMGGILNTL